MSEWSNALIWLNFFVADIEWEAGAVISQLKVMKTHKRTSLLNESLDNLLLLTSAEVSLSDFCLDDAIELSWRDKVCRPDQSKRKHYEKHAHCTPRGSDNSSSSKSAEGSNYSDTEANLLTEWDEWMGTTASV